MQGGFRLELMVHDAAAGNLSRTYHLTSPAGRYIGASNITYVRKDVETWCSGQQDINKLSLSGR